MRRRPGRRFILSLARELGMSPAQVLNSHSSREITEWMAYFQIEFEDYEQRNRQDNAAAAVKASQDRPGRFR